MSAGFPFAHSLATLLNSGISQVALKKFVLVVKHALLNKKNSTVICKYIIISIPAVELSIEKFI